MHSLAASPGASCSRPAPAHSVAVAATQRQWGSNWGKSNKPSKGALPRLSKAADTTLSFNQACKQLASAAKEEFLKQGVNSSCIPVSCAFLEAIESLDTGAAVKLKPCYLHVVQNKFLRHMCVTVDGQQYDPAGEVARAAIAAEGLPDFGMRTTDVLPPGATSLGWGGGPQFGGGAQQDASADQEAEMLTQLSTAAGRQYFWNGAPPGVLQARQEILALSSSLKENLTVDT